MLFHIGPQKTATTWIYRCISEHPEVCVPDQDTIHYFDMFYTKGAAWYNEHFSKCNPDQQRFDPTYTYIRSPLAPKRIAEDFPESKISLTIRNPIERAFSHYWHEKKKGSITFSFSDMLNNYDLFASWIEPGFYAEYLERYLEFFPREQILCLRFENIGTHPQKVINELCAFYGISEFTPTWLEKVSNPARSKRNLSGKLETKLQNIKNRHIPILSKIVSPLHHVLNTHNQQLGFEHLSDIDQETIENLQEIFNPEIERLEKMTGEDLTNWKSYG